jgi:uncharacterized membrane protein
MLLSISQWLEGIGWIAWLNASPVGAAIVEVVHYFSMFMIVGSIGIVDLRLLGVTGGQQTATELAEQVFPTMWLGVILSTITGSLMAAGAATQYYHNSVFYTKDFLILLAIVFGIVIKNNVKKWDNLPSIPVAARLIAFVSLALWIGAILAGVEVPAITGVG